MAKNNKEDFKNHTKCWTSDNSYLDGDVKISDHCDISGKYYWRFGACNINVNLNHKILVVFHNLKKIFRLLYKDSF